jgi:hypothetical protein
MISPGQHENIGQEMDELSPIGREAMRVEHYAPIR